MLLTTAKKTKLKLTTGTALIVAAIVLIIIIAFGASGQTAKFFAPSTIQPVIPNAQLQIPDLVVTDISWHYAPAALGGVQTLYVIGVTIKNQGSADVNQAFGVTLTDTTNNVQLPPAAVFFGGGQPVCQIKALKAGQITACMFVASVGDTNPFSITAYADVPVKFALVPNIGAIKESNENNNAKTIKMGCSLYPFNGKCGNKICEKHNVQNNCPDLSETLGPVANCPNDCSVCGDGIVSGFEGCDDGNTVSGDGCSSKCINEPSGPIQPQEIPP